MCNNLNEKSLAWTFFCCLIFTLAVPTLLPSLRLLFFAPFLMIAMYQKPLPTCLWLAFICGLILDLLSSSTRLGINALNFCLALILLFPQRQNFFADSLSTLPIMTFLFSLLSTAIMGITLYSLDIQNIFSIQWAIADLLIMPAADALYAFCLFTFPALLLGKRLRTGKDYFLSRE